MKIGFCTLGCKVNQYETEALKEIFSKNGWEIGDLSDFCDAYIINTCTVTSLSDRKSRQMIRRAVQKNPNATVAVCGCYAQMSPEDVSKIEGVDIVVGTKNKLKIYELIANNKKSNIVEALGKDDGYEEMEITLFESKTRAIIKAQDGCNNFCSYCIIPYARGRIRSRSLDSIYNECLRLAKNGFLEIVLAGIHICSYGKDLNNVSLIDLLKKIHEIPELKRIRLSSIEPNAFTDEFIETLKALPKVCRHFHISLQSGCDETLKRMNRRYDSAFYKNICDKILKAFPEAAITTDLITGFPGETDEEFKKTCEFTKKIAFADSHIFQYSPRPGTPAAGYDNQIDPQVKDTRSKRIMAICADSKQKFMERFLGETREVLFEQPVKNGYFEGKTANYQNVLVKTKEDLAGEYKLVLLKDIKNGNFIGEIVE